MTLYSLLYASRSLIDPADVDAEVRRLVDIAAERNREREITGALICSGGRFAQVLEGTRAELDLLLRNITADTRHTEISVLQDTPIATRRFSRWSLAYIGQSNYVQRSIALPLAQARRGSAPAVDKLLSLIDEFVLQA